MKKITKKDMKLTRRELKLINAAALALVNKEERPIVLLVLAAHLIGTVVRCSEGVFDKKSAVELVDTLVQI